MRPGLKRKKETETLRKRHVIARLYLQGMPQHAIGEKLELSQPTVAYHLKAIRDEWRKSALYDFNERKSQEVAKLDEVERCAFEAWAKSRSGKPEKEGNPAFLNVVLNCIQKRMDIFGLAAPIQVMGGVSLPWLEEEPKDVEVKIAEPEKIEP